jgi:uncharacterized protein YggE
MTQGVNMHRFAGFTLAALLAAAPLSAQDTTAASAQAPSIVTSGEAIVRRAADQAFVSLAVETRARTPRETQQQNADAMSSVQQRLSGLGFSGDTVRTTGYSIEQEFDFANGRRTPRGYVARNGLEVRVDDVRRAGEVLDAAVAAGATTVSSIRFDLKDRAAAEREALRLAVADARARAEAIAGGAGRAVDRILRIVETPEPRYRVPQPRMMAAGVAAAETPVESGTIEVHAQVELTVGIK